MRFLAGQYPFRHPGKRLAVFCLDLIGAVLFLPFKLMRRPLDQGRIRRILVIRVDHIGDVVMTRPALEALHERFAHAEIDLLVSTESAPLFDDAREIREVITFRHNWFSRKSRWPERLSEFMTLAGYLRTRRYDLAVDFRGDFRNILLMFCSGIANRLGYAHTGGGFLLGHSLWPEGGSHQVRLNLELLAPLKIRGREQLAPFPYAGSAKRYFWERFEKQIRPTGKPRIVIHPGAGYPSKRWGGLKFFDLIKKVIDEGMAQLILIGTEEEKAFLPEIVQDEEVLVDLRGKTELRDLPILFDSCDLYLGNDSGPAHIAAAQGLEMVVLFSGTNDPELWRPWTKKIHLITHDVPCSPCEAKECPLGHHECLEKITVNSVFKTLKEILRRRRQAEGAL